MFVRLPRFLVLPVLAVAGLVIAVNGVAELTTRPRVTVHAEAASGVTVNVLDEHHKVERTVVLGPGESSTLVLDRGTHTISSTKADGKMHDITVKLGFADHYAVPTAPDQCFALLDIRGWYQGHGSVEDLRVLRRVMKSEPYELPDEAVGSLREIPRSIDRKDKPKLVAGFPCAKLGSAMDSDILAALGLWPQSTALTSGALPAANEPAGEKGNEAFTSQMSERRPEWVRVYEDESALAYRDKTGEFLVFAVAALPTAAVERDSPGTTAAFLGAIDDGTRPGVYRSRDLVASLHPGPGPTEPTLKVGGVQARLVLHRADGSPAVPVKPRMLVAIGGHPYSLARENAKLRYGGAAAKCLARATAAQPVVCSKDPIEATGILMAIAETGKVKGKFWLRADLMGLQIAKATRRPAPGGFLDTTRNEPLHFTFESGNLTPGLD